VRGDASLPEVDVSATVRVEIMLDEGIQALGLDLDTAQRASLHRFIELLTKWNRVYSLTSVGDPGKMVIRHILDSLAVIPYLMGPRVLDFGTGPGLPGLVLAIARPDWGLTLLDSSLKKLRFVRQAIQELNIDNAEVVETRIEAYQSVQGFDTAITRAFGTLAEISIAALPVCASEGVIAAMKGAYPDTELAEVVESVQIRNIHRLKVPGLHAERHLVIMQARN
jgi:16S rRNA (guanine527-N7)-methyltransferase